MHETPTSRTSRRSDGGPVAVAAYIAAICIGLLSLWFIFGVLGGIAGSIG